MQGLLFVLTFIAALGAGLVAGIFFGFSAFIMTALGRIPSPKGISAMQSIIVAVLNPVFFSAFFAALSVSPWRSSHSSIGPGPPPSIFLPAPCSTSSASCS
jgi:uncharacterized membrane protein